VLISQEGQAWPGTGDAAYEELPVPGPRLDRLAISRREIQSFAAEALCAGSRFRRAVVLVRFVSRRGVLIRRMFGWPRCVVVGGSR